MKKFVVVCLLFITVQFAHAQTVTTFILVRHAEKATDGGNDPDLKPEGAKRAEAFAALFSRTTVDAVYSTNYKRTRNTVTPLANAKNLSVTIYSNMKTTDLELLFAKHSGGTIVIAGHSNTIPEIANALIGEKRFEQFADDDYGNIIIVSVATVGKHAKVVWLRY